MVTTRTRTGTPVEVYHEADVGRKPIIGAWFCDVKQEWIPASWTTNGYYIPEEDRQTGLDLDIIHFEINK